jgi:hypothetical protein
VMRVGRLGWLAARFRVSIYHRFYLPPHLLLPSHHPLSSFLTYVPFWTITPTPFLILLMHTLNHTALNPL